MKIDKDDLKRNCAGRFASLMKSLAPELKEVIDNGRRGSPCPHCGGDDRASVFADFEETGGIHCRGCELGYDIFAVLMTVRGCDFKTALRMVNDVMGGNVGFYPTRTVIKSLPADYSKEIKTLTQIWDETEPPGERVSLYLRARGISVEAPPTLRFHPSLQYFTSGRFFPAIVTQYTIGNLCVGLHIIYLSKDNDGKAPVKANKIQLKCVDTLRGSVMELYPVDNFSKRLFLCEGLENALVLRQTYKAPVWASGTASLLKGIILPKEVKEVVISVDKDKSNEGEKASIALADRLVDEGVQVSLARITSPIPEGKKSLDCVDILNKDFREKK